eukprot:7732565-Pyramimonas_sp.AAC.1
MWGTVLWIPGVAEDLWKRDAIRARGRDDKSWFEGEASGASTYNVQIWKSADTEVDRACGDRVQDGWQGAEFEIVCCPGESTAVA